MKKMGGMLRGHELRATADAPNWVPVVAIVVVGIQGAIVVVQVVTVVAIARVRGRRPPVSVGTGIVEAAIVVVPAIDRTKDPYLYARIETWGITLAANRHISTQAIS